ncbi:hypothetical protein ACOMHN_055137 [Nucella lapillus]
MLLVGLEHTTFQPIIQDANHYAKAAGAQFNISHIPSQQVDISETLHRKKENWRVFAASNSQWNLHASS